MRILPVLLLALVIGPQLGATTLPLLRPCDRAGECGPGSDCDTTCPQCPCSSQCVLGDVVSSDASSPVIPLARSESHTVTVSLPLNPTSIFHVPKPTLG